MSPLADGNDAPILIIDDDQFVREFAVHVVEFSTNNKVVTFDSGFRAWQYIQRSPGDVKVVVADANIPDMDGLELLERLKECYPDIIVIVLSGNPHYEKRAHQMGADAFLAKPFNAEDMFTILKQLVDLPFG